MSGRSRVFAAAVALLLPACGSAAEKKNMKWKPNQWQGYSCAVQEPSYRVITSSAQWTSLWEKSIGANAPEVDFSKNFAVAVFAGAKPTGGYKVEIFDAAKESGELVVPYHIVTPPAGAILTQAFTEPYAVRVFKSGKRPVKVVEKR